MNAKEFKLDYFQFYDIEIPKDVRELSPLVRLQGQFDEEEPEWAKPQYLKKFANPVSKNGETIFDKNAHLTWYDVTSSDPKLSGSVKVANQFYEHGQEFGLGAVVAMLVPAQKRETRDVFTRPEVFTKPTKLDHYKVYLARFRQQSSQLDPVILKDQFQKRNDVYVYNPTFFAVPVTKDNNGKVFPIQNPNAHLTIYQVAYSKDMPNVIDARDQFGTHRYLKMGVSYLLAVPSKKVEWKEEG